MRPRLAWWFGHGLEGPHQGEFGWRSYEGTADIPVGRWVQFSVFLRQSNGFDGAIKVWQDGNLVIDERNVRTGWPSSRFNPWAVDQSWSVNNYSDGLSPSPADIYVDDARISVEITG
jgi:hypothetical protein